MSWSDPATRQTGDLITAAIWNQDVVANTQALYSSLSCVQIADTLLSAAASSIDFQNIPATYRHLLLVGVLRDDASLSLYDVCVRCNNDSGANYDWCQAQLGTGYSGSLGNGATEMRLARMPGEYTAGNNKFAPVFMLFPCYASTAIRKSCLAYSGGFYKDASCGDQTMGSGVWRSTSAINRLTLTPSAGNFIANSRMTLYGLVGGE